MKGKLTIADVIWFFIGAGSFLLFTLVTGVVAIICLLLDDDIDKLLFIPVAIVLWGIWAGFYMGIKHLRSRP